MHIGVSKIAKKSFNRSWIGVVMVEKKKERTAQGFGETKCERGFILFIHNTELKRAAALTLSTSAQRSMLLFTCV